MIDFDALVLGPAMAVFARPIVVAPIASMPGAATYPAWGIWGSKPVDVQMENGSVMSSQDHTLGVRLSEFLVPVAQGDQIEIPAAGSLPRIGTCLVEDADDDGQGGAVLSLKIVGP